MNVSGEMLVFRNDHDKSDGTKWYSYATTISKKRQNEESWARAYIDVLFRKDVIVENKSRINVKDGFLTVREYTDKDGKTQTRLAIMVLDFEEATGEPKGYSALSMDDVPF